MQYRGIHSRKGYAILLIFLMMLFFLPFMPLLIWSFAQHWRFPDLFPMVSLRAWRDVFSAHSEIFEAIFNSLGLAIATSLLSQIVAYPASRALGIYVKRWNKTFRLLLIAPILTPGVSIAMGVHVLFLRLGLSDHWVGVLLSHLISAIPYSIYLMYGFYAGYDLGYEKQVRLLGANRWQAFRWIELPLLRPALSLSLLFSFLISWSQYLFTVLIGGGQLITLPMLLFSTLARGDYARMGALCMIFVVPALLTIIISSRDMKQDRYDGREGNHVNPIL